MKPSAFALFAVLVLATVCGAVETTPVDPFQNLTKDVTQGALRAKKADGGIVECPLDRTDVEAEISGFIARAKVAQTFRNPLDETIEAVYVFPLPHQAAVDDMTMVIGERRIVGVIKRRAEAREIYEEAVARGATAALLEQERPNIFTQSVGNIKPGQTVRIEISYVDVLEYDLGVYSFHFPMVVGPRYIPGTPKPSSKPRASKPRASKPTDSDGPVTHPVPDTDRVPDASRITPPVLKPGWRTGHDIRLSVYLDAGVPIQDIESPNHETTMTRDGPSRTSVEIKASDSIPNKDFVLRYGVVGAKPEMAVLTHTDRGGQGYFLLMVQPKEDERLRSNPPRELSFLIDVSGSMSGNPTAKVIETMKGMLKLARPEDTVQVVTFASWARKLFPGAVPCTAENIQKALNFTEGLKGSGGTEMLKGVRMAISEPLDAKRVRTIVMLTDGFIGNEAEIIEEVGTKCGDQIRFWVLGIGNSVNRMLVDGVAKQGGGMGKVLGLNEDPKPLVQEIMFRIQRAQLAHVHIDWGALRVYETYPARIPELWAGRPIVLFGMYDPAVPAGTIHVRGRIEGEPASWPLQVRLPRSEPKHDVLAKVWARRKIEDLMHQAYYGDSPAVEEAVTSLALEYRLMSPYTSFVAVDPSELGRLARSAQPPRRMLVPVPIPEGTRFEGFFDERRAKDADLEFTFGLPASTASAAPWSTRNRRPILALPPVEAPPSGRAMDPAAGRMGARYRGYMPARQLALARSNRHGWGYGVGGGDAVKGPAVADESLFAGRRLEGDVAFDADWSLTRRAIREVHAETKKAATKAFQQAAALAEDGKRLEARALYAYVYLLEAARMQMGLSSGDTAVDALEAIEMIDAKLRESWTDEAPALDKRLDLVIRDASLADALQRVAKAAGLDLDVAEGCLDDVADMARVEAVRVTYLDLRGATATQALDWLLLPERLQWRMGDRRVRVTSARRAPVPAPWVYDVSLMALPSAEELAKVEDWQKRVEAARKEADAFLDAIRKHLDADDDQVLWYAPGQLLVFGDAARHSRAVSLFEMLRDPKSEPPEVVASLHETTSQRYAERSDDAAKLQRAADRYRMMAALGGASWQLLAEAAAGKLDLKALTELQVAWASPELDHLLAAKPDEGGEKAQGGVEAMVAGVAMRSLWAISEASKSLPKEKELSALVETARKASEEMVNGGVLRRAERSPDDLGIYLAALYAHLAGHDVTPPTEGDAPLRVIAAALLAAPEKIDREALGKVVSEDLRGPDAVVLAALACRRASGEVWDAFRAEQRTLLGRQPLPGSVVVFVHRLGRPSPVLASAAP